MNATHLETRIQALEDEVTAFRNQLLRSQALMDTSELQRLLGTYTARRKAELGLFCRFDT